MTSGAMLFEHEVMLSNKPAALQVLVALTDNPGGTVKPVFGVPATAAPFEAKAVCEDSTDTPNQAIWFQSSTNRIAGWRDQLKPTTYCASMVSGVF